MSGEQTNIGGVLRTETEQGSSQEGQSSGGLQPEFKLGVTSDFRFGDFFGQATAVFKFFEENGLGEIISNPSIVVRDRNEGKIQIGSDFSVRTRDFAGDTTEKFFPTGTIIIVTPYIHKEGGLDYVLLNVAVERNSFSTSETTTEIKKTTAAAGMDELTGGLKVINQAYAAAPLEVKNAVNKGGGGISALDFAMTGLLGSIGMSGAHLAGDGGMAPEAGMGAASLALAFPAARLGARSLLTSDPWQKYMVKPPDYGYGKAPPEFPIGPGLGLGLFGEYKNR